MSCPLCRASFLLNQLEVFDNSNMKCSICYSTPMFNPRILPCNHSFCQICIVKWVIRIMFSLSDMNLEMQQRLMLNINEIRSHQSIFNENIDDLIEEIRRIMNQISYQTSNLERTNNELYLEYRASEALRCISASSNFILPVVIDENIEGTTCAFCGERARSQVKRIEYGSIWMLSCQEPQPLRHF